LKATAPVSNITIRLRGTNKGSTCFGFGQLVHEVDAQFDPRRHQRLEG